MSCTGEGLEGGHVQAKDAVLQLPKGQKEVLEGRWRRSLQVSENSFDGVRSYVLRRIVTAWTVSYYASTRNVHSKASGRTYLTTRKRIRAPSIRRRSARACCREASAYSTRMRLARLTLPELLTRSADYHRDTW